MRIAPNPMYLQLVNIFVVLAVGIGLLVVSLGNRDLARRGVDADTRSACSSAGLKVHPDALSEPASLAKWLIHNEKCYQLNGVKATTAIKLP